MYPRKFRLYHALWQGLDFIFPPQCAACGKPGNRICSECMSKIERLPDSICPLCGEPQKGRELCEYCKKKAPLSKAIRSYGYFRGPLRAAIHRVKYHQDMGLAEELCGLLIEKYQHELKWPIDVVTAIPLSRERYFERGYNQAFLFARPFAWAIQKPFIPNLVQRKRNTSSQVGLSRSERQKNIQDAFLGQSRASGMKVLVLDDVTTTGATLMECAKALRDQGAQEVYGLTLAKTPSHSNQHFKINENLI